MSRASGRVVLLLSGLTAALYALLSFPRLFATIGGSRPEAPLLLDFRDAPGSPHWIPVLSWTKVILVVVLVVVYAVLVVGVVRRRYRASEIVGTAVLSLVTILVIVFWSWPELTMAFGEQVQAKAFSRSLVRFHSGFPGDRLGLTVATAVLQVLIALGAFKLLVGGDRPTEIA